MKIATKALQREYKQRAINHSCDMYISHITIDETKNTRLNKCNAHIYEGFFQWNTDAEKVPVKVLESYNTRVCYIVYFTDMPLIFDTTRQHYFWVWDKWANHSSTTTQHICKFLRAFGFDPATRLVWREI